MAILAECPFCHVKQASKNRRCTCGADLIKAKRAQKVRYWITYRLPGGKQRKEAVGFSIEDARAAEGKRKTQKKENRIFDIVPESKITFNDLAAWYVNLKSVQRLSSYRRVRICLNNFNKHFGKLLIRKIKPEDLENYQYRREQDGSASATIDMELSIVKTMINKAFDNDKIDGRAIKAFRCVKRRLKGSENARARTLSFEEYFRLIQSSPVYLRSIIITAFHTGMRKGELLKLQWSHVDQDKRFFRLPAGLTKEGKSKLIPVNHHVREVLNNIPKALHHDFVFTYKGYPISPRFSKIAAYCL